MTLFAVYSVVDLKLITFPEFKSDFSKLQVFEKKTGIPFDLKRVFVISSEEKISRGNHAHKACFQLMIPLLGMCEVICDDGDTKQIITLNDSTKGLLVPPTIWASQSYEPKSLLMVLSDQVYDESDYLRSYDEFLKFRALK